MTEYLLKNILRLQLNLAADYFRFGYKIPFIYADRFSSSARIFVCDYVVDDAAKTLAGKYRNLKNR